MNDFENRLRAVLHDRAERAAHAEDMTEAAIGRARTIRRRRTVTSVVAAVSVIAIAVPIAVYAGGSLGRSDGPVAPPPSSATAKTPTTATVTRSTTAPPASPPTTTRRPSQVPTSGETRLPGPVRSRLDLTSLKRGGQPQITYVDGAAVVVDGHRVVSKNTDLRPSAAAAAGRGAVMTYTLGDSQALVVLDADGNELRTFENVTGFRSSRDESAVAFATTEYNQDGSAKPGTTLYHRDNSSGAVRSVRIPGAYNPTIHAVIGDTVYFRYKSSASAAEGGTLRRWVAGTGRPGRVSSVPWPTAVSDDAAIAATLRSLSDYGSCSAVIDVATGNQRWRTCDNQLPEFAPAGRFVLGTPAYGDGYAPAKISIRDTADGSLLREWTGVFPDYRFEDADHVLLLAEQDGKGAIVRCAISTGSCELATRLTAGTGDRGTARYRLGS